MRIYRFVAKLFSRHELRKLFRFNLVALSLTLWLINWRKLSVEFVRIRINLLSVSLFPRNSHNLSLTGVIPYRIPFFSLHRIIHYSDSLRIREANQSDITKLLLRWFYYFTFLFIRVKKDKQKSWYLVSSI